MALSWEQVIVEAVDPEALGRWWLKALDWELVHDDPAEFEIRPVDVGQGDVSWQVLLDPEGNEFCILSSAAN